MARQLLFEPFPWKAFCSSWSWASSKLSRDPGKHPSLLLVSLLGHVHMVIPSLPGEVWASVWYGLTVRECPSGRRTDLLSHETRTA